MHGQTTIDQHYRIYLQENSLLAYVAWTTLFHVILAILFKLKTNILMAKYYHLTSQVCLVDNAMLSLRASHGLRLINFI